MKLNEQTIKDIDRAFKALEERDELLDKIRAEIIQVANHVKLHDEKLAFGLKYAVKILDKYRAENENNDETITEIEVDNAESEE